MSDRVTQIEIGKCKELDIYIMCIVYINTGFPKKRPLRIFRANWMIFSTTVLNSKISCISTSFKKEISI